MLTQIVTVATVETTDRTMVETELMVVVEAMAVVDSMVVMAEAAVEEVEDVAVAVATVDGVLLIPTIRPDTTNHMKLPPSVIGTKT